MSLSFGSLRQEASKKLHAGGIVIYNFQDIMVKGIKMALDISNLTKKELVALRRKVDRAIESIDARTLDKARREARQLAQSYGVPLEDLIEAPKSSTKPGPKPKARASTKRGKVAPKYRDPANPNVTWSGRGRTPKWVAEALKRGASLADLAV